MKRDEQLRASSPSVSRSDLEHIRVPIVLGHLKSEPVHFIVLTPLQALRLAEGLVGRARYVIQEGETR